MADEILTIDFSATPVSGKSPLKVRFSITIDEPNTIEIEEGIYEFQEGIFTF